MTGRGARKLAAVTKAILASSWSIIRSISIRFGSWYRDKIREVYQDKLFGPRSSFEQAASVLKVTRDDMKAERLYVKAYGARRLKAHHDIKDAKMALRVARINLASFTIIIAFNSVYIFGLAPELINLIMQLLFKLFAGHLALFIGCVQLAASIPVLKLYFEAEPIADVGLSDLENEKSGIKKRRQNPPLQADSTL